MENETRTVQKYRHAARRSLTEARETLSVRTPETKEVYLLLNGQIEEIIRGRTGLSQEAQVEHLSNALAKVEEGIEVLPEKIAAAKASVIAIVESWEETILAKAREAADTLTEAKEFAANRDFAAWQEQKGRPVYPAYTETSEDDYEDEESDED